MIKNTVTKWRTEKNVSKAHMARWIGVKRSYMTKLEKGRLQPSGDMMFRIAEYLKLPLETVFQHVQDKIVTPFLASERCLKGKQISHSCPASDEKNKNAGIKGK
jgi:putative transcriptional regulator